LYRKLIEGGEPEVVTWRLSGASVAEVLPFELADSSTSAEASERQVYLPNEKKYAMVPVYQRYGLVPGTEVASPAVLVEPESTLVVAYPGRISVLASGTVRVELD